MAVRDPQAKLGVSFPWLRMSRRSTESGVSHGTKVIEGDARRACQPWTLSKKAEFMLGVGPAWVHTTKYGMTTNSVSGEVVLDFMLWPSAKHRFGWYLEPGYEYNFGRGHEQSLGISGGLLIATHERSQSESEKRAVWVCKRHNPERISDAKLVFASGGAIFLLPFGFHEVALPYADGEHFWFHDAHRFIRACRVSDVADRSLLTWPAARIIACYKLPICIPNAFLCLNTR